MTTDELSVLRDKSASRRSEWQRLTPDGKREFAMQNVEPLMGDVELLVAECDRLRERSEIFEAALSILHARSCRTSDFLYSVLSGKGDEPIKAIKEAIADSDAVYESRTERFKARFEGDAAIEGRNPTND